MAHVYNSHGTIALPLVWRRAYPDRCTMRLQVALDPLKGWKYGVLEELRYHGLRVVRLQSLTHTQPPSLPCLLPS